MLQAFRELLAAAGVQPEEVGLVMPMGGSFDLPCVREAIE
jgi:hypothetical protein